jgi:hypothetical protein
MFERLLFKRIELWLVCLIFVALICFAVVFGWAVHHKMTGGERLGALGPLVIDIANSPNLAKTLYEEVILDVGDPDLLAWDQRFEGKKGFQFNYAPGGRPDLGYVLLNRYDKNIDRAVSELVDLNSQEMIHRWVMEVDPVWQNIDFKSNFRNVVVDEASKRFESVHAFLLPSGEIIVKSHHSPILTVDACSKARVFAATNIFHHSIEQDHEGNFWVPGHLEPQVVSMTNEYFADDAIIKLSPSGEILYQKSVAQILQENGLDYILYSGNPSLADADPIHLNDIQPVLTDGRVWKTGDVFISIRNKSKVFLFRPSTNKVLWMSGRYMLHQHDVDIIGDGIISVFDNDSLRRDRNVTKNINGTNKYLVIDLADNTVRFDFLEAFVKNDIRTLQQGLSDRISDNELFVEETNQGRVLQVKRDGSIVWQYVNRADNGMVYQTSWSRILPRDYGDKVKAVLNGVSCN